MFAKIILHMKSNQALCLGRLIERAGDRPTVVTERRRRDNPGSSVISRTQQFLHFENRQPAVMLVDFDRKGMPQDIVARIDGAGGAWNALVDAIPGLSAAGRISRASTSAGVYSVETGERYAGSGGEHHYLLVADGSDIPRALNDLHEGVWLSGLGWYMVGGAGQLLDRSVVDGTVGSPERLVFEGAPVMVSPLAQDRSSRLPLVTEGIAIDTKAVVPPLTDAERDIVRSLKDLARKQLQGEADRVREQSDRSLAKDISESAGIHFETALRQVRARHDGALLPSIILEFDDSDLGTVTVGHLLDNPDHFVGETLADPLEGTAYGRCKAKVMRGDDDEIFIHSFAHGRTVYHLVLDEARLKKEIEAAQPQSAIDVFMANLFRARLEPDELEELRHYVAKRAGVGVRQIDRRMKAACEARAKTEADRAAAAMPFDGRITFPVPEDDAEMTAVMKRIDEVLCKVKDPEPPMRNSSGALCEVRTRRPLGLRLLVSQRDQAAAPEDQLPAPAEPLISELDVDHATMAIERHIRHTRVKRHGTDNVRLPTPFARAFQSYSSSNLPRVSGIVTAPLVTETGLLATNGLDRDLELVFRIDPRVLRLVPEPSGISNQQAHRAYRFLADEWLCDVLTTEEGKALSIVSALTLLERVLLPERPAFFITAGQRGGGKTTDLPT